VKDLESLASLIAADLRVADDDDDAALEARRRIASEYQSLDAEERVRLNLLLGTVKVLPPPKVSRESEQLMSDLKRHGPSTPSPSRPRARPTSRARPDPPPRLSRRPFKYAEPKYASVEYISEPVEHTARVTRLTFSHHPFIRHGWPYSNASWCVVCGEIESRHE
jgi:hypothetical protein